MHVRSIPAYQRRCSHAYGLTLTADCLSVPLPAWVGQLSLCLDPALLRVVPALSLLLAACTRTGFCVRADVCRTHAALFFLLLLLVVLFFFRFLFPSGALPRVRACFSAACCLFCVCTGWETGLCGAPP